MCIGKEVGRSLAFSIYRTSHFNNYSVFASLEMAHLSEKEVFAKTIYAEARGESRQGQEWVGWVIKNRARMNREYWGGSSIKNVCLKPGQFECWNGKNDIPIKEPAVYQEIVQWSAQLFDAPANQDPTGGADHYNNPTKGGYPTWTKNCSRLQKIGNHQFYKGP
jgi:N-acetylmuramoyl-L-alanine amidase